MKILHINTMDYGGAAKACLRLHQGLLLEGVSSKVLLRYKTSQIHEGYLFTASNLVEILKVKLAGLRRELNYFSKQERLEITLKEQRKGLEVLRLVLSQLNGNMETWKLRSDETTAIALWTDEHYRGLLIGIARRIFLQGSGQ